MTAHTNKQLQLVFMLQRRRIRQLGLSVGWESKQVKFLRASDIQVGTGKISEEKESF